MLDQQKFVVEQGLLNPIALFHVARRFAQTRTEHCAVRPGSGRTTFANTGMSKHIDTAHSARLGAPAPRFCSDLQAQSIQFHIVHRPIDRCCCQIPPDCCCLGETASHLDRPSPERHSQMRENARLSSNSRNLRHFIEKQICLSLRVFQLKKRRCRANLLYSAVVAHPHRQSIRCKLCKMTTSTDNE
jgi:hypothetical protein